MANISNCKEEDKLLLKEAGLYFAEDRLSHAYLFEGGQDSVLRLFECFCRRIFHDYDGLDPGHDSIYNIEDLLIEDSERISIDRVREIIGLIYRKPLRAKHRLIFLKNAGNMLEPAQNALLKSLEEPPDHLIWVLGAVNRSSLLDTIRSRCRYVRAPELKKVFDSDRNEDDKYFENLLVTCIKGRGIEIFMNGDILDAKKRDISKIPAIWTGILSEALEYSLTGLEKDNHTERWAIIKEVSLLLSPDKISRKIIDVEKTGQGLKNNWNQQLALEHLCLKLGD